MSSEMDHTVVTLTRTIHNSMAVEDKHWVKDEALLASNCRCFCGFFFPLTAEKLDSIKKINYVSRKVRWASALI